MDHVGIEYTGPGAMSFYPLGDPPSALQPTEILVRTRYSGITNGTERHSLLGEHGWKGVFPSRNGYQHVGTVERIGSAVQGFKEGDTVFLGLYVGHKAWHVVDVGVHPTGAHLCLSLPSFVSHQDCALLGVAGVAMRGVRRCRVGAGDKVWVAGLGLIGQFAAQCARALGAWVAVSDIQPKRLCLAQDLGSHMAVDARLKTAFAQLKSAGPFHKIVDACGVESLFLNIHDNHLLAHNGAILALAVRSETLFHWSTFHGREASIEVSCHFSLDDLRILLHFMRQDIIRVRPLISHTVPIQKAPEIYEQLRDHPKDLLGVVFDWSES